MLGLDTSTAAQFSSGRETRLPRWPAHFPSGARHLQTDAKTASTLDRATARRRLRVRRVHLFGVQGVLSSKLLPSRQKGIPC
jgi:hypothetical protein